MRLAGDLADWHGLQVGTLRLDRRPTSLAVLAAEVLRELEPGATLRGVTLHLEGAPGLPPAEVDAERLGRALAGLVEDAVRRSPAGGQVALRLAASADELAGAIRDHGLPLAAKERERVFGRYYRYDARPAQPGEAADASAPLATRFTPGDTGLSLYLSRRLIKAHGGHLWVAEDDEPGNTYRFILPLEGPARGDR
jgi:signal transduction histidine kinase